MFFIEVKIYPVEFPVFHYPFEFGISSFKDHSPEWLFLFPCQSALCSVNPYWASSFESQNPEKYFYAQYSNRANSGITHFILHRLLPLVCYVDFCATEDAWNQQACSPNPFFILWKALEEKRLEGLVKAESSQGNHLSRRWASQRFPLEVRKIRDCLGHWWVALNK